MRTIKDEVLAYLAALDESVQTLSAHHEGKLTNLPAWCLTHREIKIGITRDGHGLVLRVIPNEALVSDVVETQELSSSEQLSPFLSPWTPSMSLDDLSKGGFTIFGSGELSAVDSPLAAPIMEERGMIGFGSLKGALDLFNETQAKKDALELWNAALAGFPRSPSFVREASMVFSRVQAVIRLKAFRERRVHRLLRDHRQLLLPPFRRCFYEHQFYLGDLTRIADFILEREPGMPALLIELESPAARVLRTNGELTAEANHARNQITDWVSFIDRDAARNASGDMAFLAGPKQRLVVMGRGLEHRDILLNIRFSNTTFWTYDLLLQQAKERWNSVVSEQGRLLGFNAGNPFA